MIESDTDELFAGHLANLGNDCFAMAPKARRGNGLVLPSLGRKLSSFSR